LPKSKINSKTSRAIRTYVKQGYTANKIQKKLQSQGLGIQRKRLLAEVRKFKGTKPKAHPQKYTPKKYRRVTPKARRPVFRGKHIAVYRYATTQRYRKLARKAGAPLSYSARYEFYGNGKDLAKAVRLALSGIVPRCERPFVECSARAFLNNPYRYGEDGEWVDRPNIES
jgi:hypothetical protein